MSIILSGSFGSFTNVNLAAPSATPPAPPGDPYWANVSLLVNTTTTDNQTNNTFIDSSTNNFTITRSGTPTQGSFSPYAVAANTSYSTSVNGGSAYFDGNGDYLGLPSNSNLNPTGDFTYEFWFYGATQASKTMLYGSAFTMQTSLSNELLVYDGTNRTVGAYTANSWNHFAIARSGSTVKAFLNGVEKTSWTNSSASFSISSGAVGGRPDIPANGWAGYISNLRIVNGTAVYTSNFTPPTSPVTAISGTSLLLNFTNAGMYDAATKNNLLGVGDTKVSTAQAKFGTTSVAFDGTGDYLQALDSNNWFFSTDNFTIECWVRMSSLSSQFIVQQGPDTGNRWIIYFSSTNGISFDMVNSSILGVACRQGEITGWSTDTWYHVALVRNGNNFNIYRNGVSIASTTSSASITNYAAPLYISGGPLIGDSSLNGYMQDLRITKGVARYTSNFTPPTEPFPTY